MHTVSRADGTAQLQAGIHIGGAFPAASEGAFDRKGIFEGRKKEVSALDAAWIGDSDDWHEAFDENAGLQMSV
jgi:hypothetical protein